MKRVMELMPRGNRELEAFCVSMTFQSLFNSQLPQFNDFDKFLGILVEAYSMVVHNGSNTPTRSAAVAAALAPPPPQSDIAALAAALVDARGTIHSALPAARVAAAAARVAAEPGVAAVTAAVAVEASALGPWLRLTAASATSSTAPTPYQHRGQYCGHLPRLQPEAQGPG